MIFATTEYQSLAREIADANHWPLGRLESKVFPDGERYRRVLSSVLDKDVALIGGTINDHETLEMYDLACAFVKYGARSLTMVIPYFGYSTMEREALPGEVLPAKTRARLFSVVPAAPFGNRVMLLDPHTPGLPHYFEHNIRHVILSSHDLILQALRKDLDEPFVLAAPDAGRAKIIEKIADKQGLMSAFLLKNRIDGESVQVKAVFGDVKGRVVVLYDDMIRSGSTLLEAARALRDAGATRVIAAATHGLFPGAAVERLRNANLFDHIYVTNSHPRAMAHASDFVRVVPVGEIFGQALVEHRIGQSHTVTP